MKNTQNTRFFFFCNVLFLHIKSYTLVLAFCYLSSWKTLLIHVSVSIVSFPHIGSFEFILSFWYLTRWKTHITHVFGNVVLFLHKRCVERVLAFWYIKLKEFQKTLFFFIILFCFLIWSFSRLFSVLMTDTLKHTQMILYWWCRFVTMYAFLRSGM